MNAVVTSLDRYQPSHSNAFQSTLSGEALRERVPAVFAAGAHERTSPSYTFISTQAVLAALASAGFLPVEARQAARAKSPMHARHLVRLRRRAETVRLRDSLPELLFLNSHDGTSAYQLRVGLLRGGVHQRARRLHGRLPDLAGDAPRGCRSGRRVRGAADQRALRAPGGCRRPHGAHGARSPSSAWSSPVRRSRCASPGRPGCHAALTGPGTSPARGRRQ